MSFPGFHDIDLVLSGVTMLNDSIDKLRQHSLEMAVNAFSRRSVQCDLEDIARTAEQIREAAAKLTTMAAETNRALPVAEPSNGSSHGAT